MRIVKGKRTKSRQMAWLNAKEQAGITVDSHIYMGSYHSLDYFKCRLTSTETTIRNLTFNNGGL
jgi:uncharacterized protein YecT (DUF1311 family)